MTATVRIFHEVLEAVFQVQTNIDRPSEEVQLEVDKPCFIRFTIPK